MIAGVPLRAVIAGVLLRSGLALGVLLAPVVQPAEAAPVEAAPVEAAKAAQQPAGPAAESSPAEALFNTHCGTCHLQMGPGTIMLGRRLGLDHALLDERLDLDAAYIRQVVRNGIGGMPPQTRVDLSDAELNAVAAYLTRPAAERRPPRPVFRGNQP